MTGGELLAGGLWARIGRGAGGGEEEGGGGGQEQPGEQCAARHGAGAAKRAVQGLGGEGGAEGEGARQRCRQAGR
eukprot:5685533-Prymnesium_polylepis.2